VLASFRTSTFSRRLRCVPSESHSRGLLSLCPNQCLAGNCCFWMKVGKGRNSEQTHGTFLYSARLCVGFLSRKSPPPTTPLPQPARLIGRLAFRPPRAPSRSVPALGPAVPVRSRAGCSSSRRSPRSAGSPPAPRPNSGSVRGVPGR